MELLLGKTRADEFKEMHFASTATDRQRTPAAADDGAGGLTLVPE
jgi:hypothetical protein